MCRGLENGTWCVCSCTPPRIKLNTPGLSNLGLDSLEFEINESAVAHKILYTNLVHAIVRNEKLGIEMLHERSSLRMVDCYCEEWQIWENVFLIRRVRLSPMVYSPTKPQLCQA